ncbi:MAG: prolipoprotein diacylglyceryl transferase [Planctomycetaceae bacterium]
MRPVLIRLLLDRPWQTWDADVQGVPGIGVALAMTLLGLLAVLWLLWRKGCQWSAEDRSNVLFWFALVLVLTFVAPLLPAWLANSLPPDPRLPQGQPPEPVTSVPIFGYGAMVLLGFVAGTWLGQRRAQKAGIDPNLVFDLTFWTLVCGVLGGRLFYIVQHGDVVFRGADGLWGHLFAAINLSRGGLVLIGAMLGGAVGFFGLSQLRQVSALKLLDLLTPSIFVGIGFGRIGCLLYGCCYGDPSSLPWAVTFGPESAAFEALVERGFVLPSAPACMPLHPTQIYSSINGFLLALVTLAYYQRRRYTGDVFALGIILYAISRFLIEFVRADELGQLGTGLTISQLLALGLLVVGLTLASWLRWRGARRTTPAITAAAANS